MIYVTSDLHGCSPETLGALLRKAGFTSRDFLFILGDVIDRGDHGAKLLLWLTEQPNVQLILGNHEAMLLACEFLFEEVTEDSLSRLTATQLALLENWLQNGGGPTLLGIHEIMKKDPSLMEGILELLHEAPLYDVLKVSGKHFVLVHAGLGNFRPDKPLSSYVPDELLYTRPDPDTRYFSDATVIFGHTPTEFFCEDSRGRACRTQDWICIDTGAAMGGNPMLLRLDDLQEFYVTP